MPAAGAADRNRYVMPILGHVARQPFFDERANVVDHFLHLRVGQEECGDRFIAARERSQL